MIRYRIKNRMIEIEYDTGLELTAIMKVLEILDIVNMVKQNERKDWICF